MGLQTCKIFCTFEDDANKIFFNRYKIEKFINVSAMKVSL
jgi:hypothetical protein